MRKSILAALALVGVLVWEVNETRRLVHSQHRSQDIYIKFRNWAVENLGADDFLVAMQLSGSAYYYLPNPLIRYEYLTPETWKLVIREAVRKDLPIYAPLFHYEWNGQHVLDERVPGVWRIEQEFGDCHLYRLDSVATLAFLE